jgi:hypothetical protein
LKYFAATLLFAAGAFVATAQPTFAADSMQSSMTMPKCASSDSIVGVNMTTKMYMTQAQMKMKMAGMSQSQMHATMTKNNIKMMCKSKADAMGAKMMKPPM